MAVGKRLHGAREEAGMSQRELAFPGCSAAYISRIERGERIPSLQVMRELARRIGLSEATLAYGRETLNPAVADRIRNAEHAEASGDHEALTKAYHSLSRAAAKVARSFGSA